MRKSASLILLAASLSGCNGMATLSRCLRTGQKATVVRVVTTPDTSRKDESTQVALRRADGITTTCFGGADAGALKPGDVIDGATLHAYRTSG